MWARKNGLGQQVLVAPPALMHRISVDVVTGKLSLRFQGGTTPHLGSGSEKMKQPPPLLFQLPTTACVPQGHRGQRCEPTGKKKTVKRT
jgi:hypothetical protein